MPTGQVFPRTAWIARRDAAAYGVVLDAEGKIIWGRSDIGGDPIVVVLTEQVPDAHLEMLRAEGVSYVFAGKQALDLRLLLEVLNRELGIERLLLEGGGRANGAFLRAGLVDRLYLFDAPLLLGADGRPATLSLGIERLDAAPRWRRIEERRLGEDRLAVLEPVPATR